MGSDRVNFKPTKRIEGFRPTGPIRQEGPEQWRRELTEQGLRPPTPTTISAAPGLRITGQPLTGMPGAPPSDSQKAAEAIAVGGSRYAFPIITGILAPPLMPAAMGLGELAAREYEDYFGKQEYTDKVDFALRRLENVGHGLIAGQMGKTGQQAMDALTARISGTVPSTFQARRFPLKVRLLPRDIRPEVETAQRFLGRIGTKEQPLSLTLGTIKSGLSGEKNWAKVMESWGRSGLLSGSLFERRAITAPRQAINKFIKEITGITDDFFTMQKRVSGPRKFGEFLGRLLTKETELTDTIRKALYKPYDDMLESTFKTVDGKLLQTLLMREGGRYAELLPKIFRGTDLLNRIDEALLWRNLPLRDAAILLRRINSQWNKVSPSERKILGYIKGHLEPQFNRVLRQTELTLPDGTKITADLVKRRADAFFAETQDRLENIMMRSVKEQLQKNPDSVLSMVRKSPETYYALRNAFKTGPIGRAFRVDEPTFNTFIRTPLKHDLVTQAADPDTGIVTGKSLAGVIDKDPIFFTEVFGKEAANELRNAATTMRVIQEGTAKGDSVFLKLVQGGELVSILGGLTAAYGEATDNPILKRIGMGTFVIFLTPTALTRIFSNAKRIRTMTDGILAGTKSEQFARMATMIGIQNRQAQLDLRQLPKETWEFYNTVRNQDLIKPSPDEEEGIPQETTAEMAAP